MQNTTPDKRCKKQGKNDKKTKFDSRGTCISILYSLLVGGLRLVICDTHVPESKIL